jgi:hypothetical protein
MAAGHIGHVAQSHDGSYGFVLYDENGHACVYFGFASPKEADSAARDVQSLIVAARRCQRR